MRARAREPLLRLTERGLFCQAGDFYIDPWRPVERAVITHAHGDHARPGSEGYLGSREGERVLRTRLGSGARLESLSWGEERELYGVRLSLHPAGHIRGSAQVRVEYQGEVWVVSGDYKRGWDPTCTPFEPLRCHTFVTESTFGLPLYHWPDAREVFADLRRWWRRNQEAGRVSVLYGYALGKAQRVLAGLREEPPGPLFTHPTVERLNADYRADGVALPPTRSLDTLASGESLAGALVVAPPAAAEGGWMRRLGDKTSVAFASGWMRVRGFRRRQGMDRGFVLSDHVDWPSLVSAVEETGAEQLLVTHGSCEAVVRYFRERGLGAEVLPSRWEGAAGRRAAEALGRVEEGDEAGETESDGSKEG